MVQAKKFYLVLVLPHPALQNRTEEVSSWPKGSISNENLEFQTEKTILVNKKIYTVKILT